MRKNWVELKNERHEQIRKHGLRLWEELQTAFEDALESFVELYPESIIKPTWRRVTDDDTEPMKFEVTVTALKARLDLTFDQERGVFKFVWAGQSGAPVPNGEILLEVCSGETVFVYGGENSADELSKMLLEDVLFLH